MAAALRVLYVDDEPDLLVISKLILEADGAFAIDTLPSAKEALEQLKTERYDAIISDYQMPDMDGIQFLAEVRARFGQIPFILFTGKGREDVVIQAINTGADFYLQKGGEPRAQFAELAHKIRQASSRSKAEEALRKREEEYRFLIEHTNEPIVVIQDGMLRLINKRTADRLGYPVQELLSIPFSVLIHPDDHDMVIEWYQGRVKGEVSPSHYTFRVMGKDGSTIWVEISVVPIAWEGRPATINFLVDITGRKQAEEAVIQTRRNYEHFFNTIKEFLFVLDEQGRILHTNETVTRRLGYTIEELLGQSVLLVHPLERREEAMCTVQGMLAGTMDFCPVPLMAKNGNLIPVETRVTGGEWNGRPVLFGVSKDISALKLSEEKFSAAFHANASLMALSTKAEGKFIDVNEVFLETLGYSRDEVIGKFTDDLGLFVNPDDRMKALRILEERGVVRGMEAAIRVKDGSVRYGLFSADTIIVGDVPCLLTTLVDITEHKLAEDLINENYQFMQTLIQTIPIPVFFKNRTGAYSGCNKAFETWYGRSHDEIIGKTVFDIAPTEIANEYFRTDEELFNNPGTVQYESRVVSTNGQTRNVIINKATIVNSNGEATGIIGVISEIPGVIREEKITYDSGEKFSGG
jgi:PAS domain S-box-containing protein